MKVRALVLAVALAACGQQSGSGNVVTPTPLDAPNANNLQIDIGRYGHMLDQVHELTAERPGAAEADPAAPKELARALREAVWQYNLERSRLCAKGLFADVACGPAYEPVWISEPATAEPTLEDIQLRATALGEEVMGLSNAVCADARSREPDEEQRRFICATE